MRIAIGIAATSLCCAWAIPGVAQEVRQLGPHVHGESHLTVAVDGNKLAMELHSPGNDIVGFEYLPTTPQQMAAVTAAMTSLKDPIGLFGIPAAARCTPGKAEVNLVEEDEDEDHAADAAKSPTTAAAAPAPTPAPPASGAPAAPRHSEFQAQYELTCTNLGAITDLNLAFFSKFPNAMGVHIDLVSAKGAFSLDVSRGKPTVSTRNMF